MVVMTAPQTKVGLPRSTPSADAARRTIAVAPMPTATIAAVLVSTAVSSLMLLTPPRRLFRWLVRSRTNVAATAATEGNVK